jgi:hypothetical protein
MRQAVDLPDHRDRPHLVRRRHQEPAVMTLRTLA